VLTQLETEVLLVMQVWKQPSIGRLHSTGGGIDISEVVMSRGLLPSVIDISKLVVQSGSQLHIESQPAELLQVQLAGTHRLSVPQRKPGSQPPPTVQAQWALPTAQALFVELVQAGTAISDPHNRPMVTESKIAKLARNGARAEELLVAGNMAGRSLAESPLSILNHDSIYEVCNMPHICRRFTGRFP
jgi:hypothetical protein